MPASPLAQLRQPDEHDHAQINRALPGLRNVGLCHSIQGTSEQLARYIGIPYDELAYWVAGINHQAWFLQLRHHTYRGEDLYPRLRAAMDEPAMEERDRVRFAVLRHFGYFVTESSRHMSEYVPWFRRTAADRDRYTPPPATRPSATGGPPPTAQERRQAMWEQVRQQIAGQAPIDYSRSREYCSFIIHAIEANAPFRFNGNVPNSGLITNLPPDCSVEVPILVDNTGLHPCYVGDLPAQLAAVNRTNVNVHELAAEGFLRRIAPPSSRPVRSTRSPPPASPSTTSSGWSTNSSPPTPAGWTATRRRERGPPGRLMELRTFGVRAYATLQVPSRVFGTPR